MAMTDKYEALIRRTGRGRGRGHSSAVKVLSAAQESLDHLESLYLGHTNAAICLDTAIDTITSRAWNQGKLIITGVGKSGLIGRKLVATFNSLAIQSCFLHPTEATHGDLGIIVHNDTILMISHSGSTAELLGLLTWLPPEVPIIVMCGRWGSEIAQKRPGTSEILAPTIRPDEHSTGVPAPTTSALVALALGDALAVSVAHRFHGESLPEAFCRNHPGGTIEALFGRAKVEDERAQLRSKL